MLALRSGGGGLDHRDQPVRWSTLQNVGRRAGDWQLEPKGSQARVATRIRRGKGTAGQVREAGRCVRLATTPIALARASGRVLSQLTCPLS